MASSGRTAPSSGAESDVLHPYTARAEAESQDRESDGGRYSTWRQEPQSRRSGPASGCSASIS